MRRIMAVVVLVLAAVVWPSGQAATAVPAAQGPGLQADFNNDGAADLVVGVPFEWVGAIQDAGAVHVLYGSAGGLQGPGSQFFTQDTPGVPGTAGLQDNLGAGLATGDFNEDGFADLAIGVPGEDIGTIGSAGAVIALYGSATGLTTTGAQLLTQAGGATELNDAFGGALAAGDFDQDGFADLAAGAPFETVGSIPEAGAVSVLYGSGGGLTRVGGQLFTQNSPGSPAAPRRWTTSGSPWPRVAWDPPEAEARMWPSWPGDWELNGGARDQEGLRVADSVHRVRCWR